MLLQKWFFPANLCEAILNHHQPDRTGTGDHPSFARIIFLGNHLAKRLEVGFHDRRIENLAETDTARDAGLDETTLEEIHEQVVEHYQSEIAIFEE
jgi:HD-like signal output (HDOD) protein